MTKLPQDQIPTMDPIHEEAGRWYFWDETWANRHGPFPDRAAASSALHAYCEYLDKPNETGDV